MIKVFRDTNKDAKGLTAFDRMTKYEMSDILHDYLDNEERKIINTMLDPDLFKEPSWTEHKAQLLAELRFVRRMRSFLPNKGKGNE
jgi:hypothetical protein